MQPIHSPAEFYAVLRSAYRLEEFSPVTRYPYLIVSDLEAAPVEPPAPLMLPNCPVISLRPGDGDLSANVHPLADLAATETQLPNLIKRIEQQPTAAATAVQLLRHNARTSSGQGLLAESLAYSTLQHSAGFKHWLQQGRQPRPDTSADSVLLIQRTEQQLALTFNRPAVHNAFNRALRDALCEALTLVHEDPTIRHVTLHGAGPSFCAGGDLSEFGNAQDDAGTAHLVRTTRSAGQLVSTFTGYSSARLHGACIGAGIELAAFCSHVSARDDAFFQLPEVAMGLVPGAGGTVSITHRIGRQRTAYMALSHARIDVETALRWGLIDEVE